MGDRDRLIELLKKDNCPSPFLCDEKCKYANLKRCYEARTADHLIANGVIVPPCKVGQIVWLVRDGKIEETTVEKIVLKDKGLYLKLLCNSFYETTCRSIGKTVFLTREEAEKVLERSKGNA